MRIAGLGGLLLLALIASPAASAASPEGRWIHVRVHDDGDRGARVDLQVPLTMVTALLPTLKAKHVNVDGNLDFGHGDTSIEELRAYWAAVRDAKDGHYVTVKDGPETVRVAKRAGIVHIDVTGHERVKIRVPVPVVEAFLGRKDTIDLDAAVRALGHAPNGELIAVDDDDSRVRIWIDDRPAADDEDER